VLTVLLATCETTLAMLNSADDAIGADLVEDLKRMAARTRSELDALAKNSNQK